MNHDKPWFIDQITKAVVQGRTDDALICRAVARKISTLSRQAFREGLLTLEEITQVITDAKALPQRLDEHELLEIIGDPNVKLVERAIANYEAKTFDERKAVMPFPTIAAAMAFWSKNVKPATASFRLANEHKSFAVMFRSDKAYHNWRGDVFWTRTVTIPK